ncbi:MAG: hypothetical protein WA126_06055 [Thermodesulfovibrionales bacterium]
MKKLRKKKKPKYRIPIDAVLKLRNHPVLSKKGEKGYNRERIKQENRKNIKDEHF